jgi:hypothetical protein
MAHQLYRRTDPLIERKVLTRIAEGVRYIDISEETAVPVPTIKKIKARNVELLAEIRKINTKQEAAIVNRNMQKAHRLLEKRLDRALAGQEAIPTRELVYIVREMFKQSQIEQHKPTEIINNQTQRIDSPEIQAAMDANDTVLLARLLFTKNKSS